MNIKSIISVLALAFVAQSQCSLTDRLAKANDKISSIKQDVKAGKVDGKVFCGRNCKNCEKSA